MLRENESRASSISPNVDLKTMDTSCGVWDDGDAKAPDLPNELWVQIFNNLSHGDLLETRVVCKHWYQLVCTSQLKRKSKLVITKRNLKDIFNLMEYKDLKYERLEIYGKWENFSSEEREFLIKIFKNLESDITQLKLYSASFLPLLNNSLPNMTELDLSCMQPWDNLSIDFKTFLNVKSILMPRSHSRLSQLMWGLIELPEIRLERLSLNINPYRFCLNTASPLFFPSPREGLIMLAAYASSLRWLKFSLSGPLAEGQRYMKNVFKKFTQLEVLDITDVCNLYTRTMLQNLSERNPLKVIVLKIYSDDYDLLELIQRKWSNTLVRVDLTCHMIGNVATPLNFTSSKIRRLFLFANSMDPEYILNSIAPTINKTLTVLTLRSLSSVRQLDGNLIQRIPYLIALDLGTPCLRITDKEMDCIFRHLIHLQFLALEPCEGENYDFLRSAANISNLKRLQTLRSCFCPIKVLQILNLNFKFMELKRLCRKYCERCGGLYVPPDVYNTYFPALEELSSFMFEVPDKDVEEMRKSLPRIRRYGDEEIMVEIF
ncbi:hypothetical protein GQX74_009826 [Glossina fuscipes]|nr:hypothetical protein GQX74_009826 [Glossina fuscipes]